MKNGLSSPGSRPTLFAAACVLLVTAGCGGDPGTSVPRPAPEPTAADGTRVAVVLKPRREDGSNVTALEVGYQITGDSIDRESFSVRAPIVYAGRRDMADNVTGMTVKDASGGVPLAVEDDPIDPSGFPFFRYWRAERPVTPPVTVSYMIHPQANPTPGPQFDLYANAGGFSAGGMAIFMLPEEVAQAAWSVRWDLGELAPGSIAASTWGDGDFEIEGDAEAVIQAYYMVGPLGRYDAPAGKADFHAYWLGQPTFDAATEMAWVAEAYTYMREFFGNDETDSYRVFLRAVQGTRGGTALRNSFFLAVDPGEPDPAKQSPRGTMFHEIGHMFVGGLGEADIGGTPWFAEGLNTYYTRLLMLRSGLAPVDDYVDSINATARNYYANRYKLEPADELRRLGFSTGVGTGSAQNVAYTRGSLYFAVVDAEIRAASGGARNLDDVILPLFQRRLENGALTQDELVQGFVDELGESARVEFEAIILDGELVVPSSAAFGPCTERRPAVFEMDDGGSFEGYEWVRIESVPDSACREF